MSVGFQSQCNSVVSGVTATWRSAYNGMVAAKDAAAAQAAAAWRSTYNAMVAAKDAAAAQAARHWQGLVRTAEAAKNAVTKQLNDFKAWAEARYNRLAAEAAKAASDATKFVNDVGDAFSELGNEIKCAHTSTQQYTPSRTQSKILCATTRVDIAQGRRQ